jgi:predicted alpha/beta-hydrolase family hydrolase
MTAGALLLTPGAGATRDNRILVSLEEAVAPLPCERIDFPYRQSGRRMPDPAPIAVAHLRAAAADLVAASAIPADRLVLGGRSYGGRMCSMAVAEGLPAAGLILLSYPLHPPGRPEKLRVEHFPQIDVPVLFVGGEKDPFGSPEEFAQWVPQIRGRVTQVWLPGGHDQRPSTDTTLIEAVTDWLKTL